MRGRVAIVAGTGALPLILVHALEAAGEAPVLAEVEGHPVEGAGARTVERFRIERLVPFLDRLHELGVGRVVFAGAVHRPRLDPAQFDPRTAALVPRLLAAMQGGDDATLRAVIAIFEEAGLEVVGATDVAPELVPAAGVLSAVQPTDADIADAERAAAIVAALGGVDVGQGAVVAQGLCLAVEALPGTDAMLSGLAAMPDMRPDPAGARGVLYKAPKPLQERRIDLPAIGPDTIRAAAAAGLGGVAIEAGGVMLLDRAAVVQAADELALFLWAR